MAPQILTINPGSTSTKVALYEGLNLVWSETLRHDTQTLASFKNISDQYHFRKEAVLEALKKNGTSPHNLACVVGRGGILKPLKGGTYRIGRIMLEDLREAKWGEHASNLGAPIAFEIAQMAQTPAFIVDPPVVDEMDPIARISGMPEIERRSMFHALNQKAVARRAADSLGRPYRDCRLIVAHLGGGISVAAHRDGRVIDVNNALDGEGPFSPERSGGLPPGDLARLVASGRFTLEELLKKITGRGGLVAYTGTNDAVQVEERLSQGDEKARLVYEAMAYQVAKDIGSCAAVLGGKVDAVVITGGLAHSSFLTDYVGERVKFIAPLLVYPGEDEMLALAEGGLRVLLDQEEAKDYS